MSAPTSPDRMDPARPFASIIIAVFNDAAGLALCLPALERQDYPAELYEVIVVDNGSNPPVAIDARAFPHARLAVESRPGVGRARATGIDMARGPVLAFTDADCVPDPGWLSKGIAHLLATPRGGLVAGRVVVTPRDPARPNLAESLGMAMHFKQERFLSRGHWAVFANAFTWRGVYDAVGPLNPELLSSEEAAWGMQVHAAGYVQVYAPDAVVRHPARTSIRRLCQRTVRLEYSWLQLRELAGIGRGRRHWLSQYLYRPIANIGPDVLLNPELGLVRKLQVTTLAGLLILVRLAAWAMMRLGLRPDVRKSWG